MDEKNEGESKLDEVMLPGFRFHPTDEELVGFYLKRKIQQRPLAIELIKQLDIYKYDPWDLPKFASTGEKEWYFYCPRDRKYRNSARPNRVTGAGFWKATGTDRPIYSSEGNKCIGLKKSLVFYKGRAAKGVKTDWMMHEFRLPSLTDTLPSKRCIDRNLPASDSWAICRIFKKISPVTPRTLSHSWVSPSLPQSSPSNHAHTNSSASNTTHFSPQSVNKTASTSPPMHLNHSNDYDNILPNSLSFLDMIPPFRPIYGTLNNNNNSDTNTNNTPTLLDLPPSYILPQLEEPSEPSKSNIDISSMLLNMSSTALGTFGKPCDGNMEFGVHTTNNVEGGGQCHDFPLDTTLSQDHDLNGDNYQDYQSALMENLSNLVHGDQNDYHHQFGGIETIGSFPLAGLLPLAMPEAWKSCPSLLWDCAPLS